MTDCKGVKQYEIDALYYSSSGLFYLRSEDDACILLARGYSGFGAGRDDPAQEAEKIYGPIPAGIWKVEPFRDHVRLGPIAAPLIPIGHNAHGRSGFYIHGDNKWGNCTASTGCIVLPRSARECLRALNVRSLEVRPYVGQFGV